MPGADLYLHAPAAYTKHNCLFNQELTMTTPPSPKWLKLTFNAPTILAEAAADLAGVLSGTGVEQTPDSGTGCAISAFFPLEDDQDDEQQVQDIRDMLIARMSELFSIYDEQFKEVQSELMVDEDLATSWQQFFHTVEIVPGLVIKPSWEEYQPAAGQQIIEMDPGRAFGTGQHASTRLALSLVAQAMKEPAQTGLDIGTGTGVLAMAAALYGAGQITAIDNDPEAVRVAQENITHNNLSHAIICSDTPLEEISGDFQLICANIIHDVLVEMASRISQLAAPGSHLVLAGILHGEQEKNITKIYAEHGFQLEQAAYEDEWVSLLFSHS